MGVEARLRHPPARTEGGTAMWLFAWGVELVLAATVPGIAIAWLLVMGAFYLVQVSQ